MRTRPFWIDTDTASDDAVALMMAFDEPSIEIVGISVVAGNVPLDQAVQNALYTRELCDRNEVPIFAGCAEPMRVPLSTAQTTHGSDGMGDIGLDLTGRRADSGDAIGELLNASHAHAGELTLVTLGPLTNLAAAIEQDPSLADRISRTVVMGGVADHIGNVTPVAEYNIWADPDAAHVVVNSGLPLEFVGWDVSRRDAVIDATLAAELRASGTDRARFAVDIQRAVVEFCASETGLDGFDLPDPIAMAYAIDPEIATEIRALHAAVETQGELTRGMVVFDRLGLLHEPPNVTVVTETDRDGFIARLRRALRSPRADY